MGTRGEGKPVTTDGEYVIPTPNPQGVDDMTARLVTEPGQLQVLTGDRATDARTALARGLLEYLSPLELVWWGGRQIKFKNANYYWAQPEQLDEYPALAIVTSQPAEYDYSCIAHTTVAVQKEGVRRYLRQVSEMRQVFEVQLWATDPEERMGLVGMVEDAFEYNDWMAGLRLELPYYFNTRATYNKLTVEYLDSPDNAQSGYFKANIIAEANVPQFTFVGELPNMRTRLSVAVEE